MHVRILIVTCLIYATSSLASSRLTDDFVFRVIRMKDGLPGSTVFCTTQDQLGFLWIGTNDGLCRYDGSKFKIYRHEPDNINSISDNYVQNLHFDLEGNLWIMTADGLDFLDLKLDQIKRIIAQDAQGSVLDNSPTDIAERSDGTLFISSYYSGISYKKKDENTYKYLTTETKGPSQLNSDYINCLHLFADSLLFIGTWSNGIDVYDIDKNETRSLKEISSNKLASERINDVCKGKEKGLWIATTDGISYFDLITHQLVNYSFSSGKFPFLVDHDIVSLYLDNDNFLWIGTRDNGLVVANAAHILGNKSSIHFRHYAPTQLDGALSYRTVLNIFNDKYRHMWLGTHGGGLNYAESALSRFNHIKIEPGNPKSITFDNIWGITESSNGEMWFGTDGGGVNVWSPEHGLMRKYETNDYNTSALSDDAVLCAVKDFEGSIWLGTYEGGINRYDSLTQSFRHYKFPGHLPVNDVRCLYEDNNQILWAGMNQGGVSKYNRSKDVFESIEKIQNYDIRAILRVQNDLYLGSFGQGLLKYNLVSDSLFQYEPNPNTPTTIFSLLKGMDSCIWIGSRDGGLYKFSLNNRVFENFNERNGLSNNTVHSILADAKNNLWLSTNKGISRFSPTTREFKSFTWTHGVQTEGFHPGSGYISNNGTFYFGGIKGVNYFKPEAFDSVEERSNIHFTGLKIFNENVEPNVHKVIARSIEFNPDIHLNFEHSVITIEFQNVRFPVSSETFFEYILEGYDKDWNKTEKVNSATYRNLPPGRYTFRVRNYSNTKALKAEEARITIFMAPPWWKTKLAYFFYFGVVILFVIGIFRYRVNQYRIKNKLSYERKLRIEEKKIHEERLVFFTNISHEFRTPLTIISVALEDLSLLRNINLATKRTIDAAVTNSNRLMELINRLLEFRQIEKGVAQLSVSKINLNQYIPDFLQGFREMANHNKINLRLMLPIHSLILWIDIDKFSMILNNLLSNAFKHTIENGNITISVDQEEKYIVLTVKNSGVQIPQSIQNKIFKRYFKADHSTTSTGIGLALTKSLVELHHGEIEVNSNPDKETQFILRFLKGNQHFLTSQLEQTEAAEEENYVVDELPVLENETGNRENQVLLLIDDNVEILELLSSKLKKDFGILKAKNGEEGMELALKYAPDLILSDIMMPGISGIEVCTQLKENPQTSHIPIILLTAKGSEEDEIKGLNTGADDYISKPFKFNVLNARIKTILENRFKVNNYFLSDGRGKSVEEDRFKKMEIDFLNRIETYILTHCLETDVSVFKLAEELGFSRTTLYRKIKSLTDMSINGFVRSVKLKKSAELIADGMNVSEAAYSTGFNDLKYFRESFKKLFGRNPSEFK